MLAKSIVSVGLCVLFGACTPAAKADDDAQIAADHLANMLESVSSVSFYFVSRTGDYSLRGDRFKAESSVMIHRKCGANCRNFMTKVISHLAESTLAECSSGQENVLMEVGDTGDILYSHSGRMIEIDGKCYFNREGIGSRIKDTNFLFD